MAFLSALQVFNGNFESLRAINMDETKERSFCDLFVNCVSAQMQSTCDLDAEMVSTIFFATQQLLNANIGSHPRHALGLFGASPVECAQHLGLP